MDVRIATSTESGTDFGMGWLGQLYIQAGYKWSDEREWEENWIDCRGSIDDDFAEYNSNDELEGVILYCQTAWGPKFESFELMIHEKYPGLKTVCLAEEPGCEVYFNSDTEGIRFLEKYIVSTEDDTYYPQTEAELLKLIDELTGLEFDSAEKLLAADDDYLLENYKKMNDISEDDGDAYISIHEFTSY